MRPARHGRGVGRQARRWGRTAGPIGFHGGKVSVERPRVRERGGKELALPSWGRAVGEDWLGRWAMNLMLIGVTTRRFGRAVRLPEGDVPAGPGAGVSKSAASRRFVALSAERMAAWMARDLSGLDLLAVQIDGIHLAEDLVLLAAVEAYGAGRRARAPGPAPAAPTVARAAQGRGVRLRHPTRRLEPRRQAEPPEARRHLV